MTLAIDPLALKSFNGSAAIKYFKVHKALLSKGMAFIEDLAGLDQLKEGKSSFHLLSNCFRVISVPSSFGFIIYPSPTNVQPSL